MNTQTTTGFSDAIANLLAADSSLGLTKGTNLLSILYDDRDKLQNQFALVDAGYEQLPAFRHMHLLWEMRLITARQNRMSALEALRPVVTTLLRSRSLATSDNSESFRILTVRPVSSPTLTEKSASGQYLAEATVQFQVIPV